MAVSNDEVLSAIKLAKANDARINGLTGSSPSGACRDIPLSLDIEQSHKLLSALESILSE